MADNLHYDIVAPMEHLEATLKLIHNITGWKKPTRYLIHPKYGMILFWHKSGKGEHRAMQLNWVDQIKQWLENGAGDPQDYTIFDEDNRVDSFTTHYNDYDVGNRKGFRIRTEAWGHVNGDHYAYAYITPAWLWSGK